MTSTQLINILIGDGSVERVSVNRYKIHSTYYTRSVARQHISNTRLYTREELLRCVADEYDADRWRLLRSGGSSTQSGTTSTQPTRVEVLRTITRRSYHSSGSGTERDGVDEALRNIPVDADGVRRSFGLEYEIYSLTREQEDKLARLLDTLPPHVTERDGSLDDTGVEIVFLPMSADKYIDTWNKLKQFVTDNRVCMEEGSRMAGAHTTYGVSNARVSTEDLQIRLNRLALAVKSVGTQRKIKGMFGRDFGNYRELPNSTTYRGHSNAFSASRGVTAWECRLCAWGGDAERIVKFLKRSEFVFNRTFQPQDFMDVFDILGGDTSEA